MNNVASSSSTPLFTPNRSCRADAQSSQWISGALLSPQPIDQRDRPPLSATPEIVHADIPQGHRQRKSQDEVQQAKYTISKPMDPK